MNHAIKVVASAFFLFKPGALFSIQFFGATEKKTSILNGKTILASKIVLLLNYFILIGRTKINAVQ